MIKPGSHPGTPSHPGPAMKTRLSMVLPVVLALAMLGALAAHPPHLPAQASRLAELRHIADLRDAQRQTPPPQVIEKAHAYLEEFPQGAYRDEALLILGTAQAASGQIGDARASLDALIDDHPDSPFREQALVESLPLLAKSGEEDAAEARAAELVKSYPNSVQRNPALLWLAGNRFAKADHAGTLRALEQVAPGAGLTEQQQTDVYRMRTIALVQTGESAWTPLSRYLQRQDSAANKAQVLVMVGQVAREAKRPEEALRYYRQIVEDYPVPEHLDEALYWRAALFKETRLSNAPKEVATARRETAIGYYTAYLKTEGGDRLPEAHLGRGELFQSAGEFPAALEDFERAVEMKPELGRSLKVVRARVALFREMERPQEALALLTAARENEDIPREDRTTFRIEEATLHYEAKACDRVEGLLNPMPIISDPAIRPRAFFMRGFCRYQQGFYEKATFDLEGLINDPQYQTLALNPLLDAYEKSGQSSRLVHLAEELLEAGRIEPEPEVFARLASGYETLGEPALMISAYQRLEQVDPQALNTPGIQAQLGRAKEKLGHGMEAEGHYRNALNLMNETAAKGSGEFPQSLYLDTLERLQGLLLAREDFESLPPLHEQAGAILVDEGSKARLTALQAGLSRAWGQAALQRGEPKKAIEHLTATLKQIPPVASEARIGAAALLVTAHLAADNPEQALTVFEAEAGRIPEQPSPAPRDDTTEGKDPVPVSETEPPSPAGRMAVAVMEAIAGQEQIGGSAPKRPQAIAFYKSIMAALPEGNVAERRAAARELDRLYQAMGDFPSRAALVKTLRKDGLDDAAKDELRVYLSSIYRDWGRHLLERNDEQGARFQLERGLALLKKDEWAERYGLVSLLGQVYLKQGAHTDLVVMTEEILPDLQDEALAGKVRHYLGQVHLDWAKSAEQSNNVKSARIRYHRALDYLPPEDWQRRLAAANGLATIWMKENKTPQAAALLAEEIPLVQEPGVAQQYALYLAKLYLNTLKAPDKAAPWLAKADLGKNDPLSVEAAYLAAEIGAETDPKDTLKRLTRLAGRKLQGSLWEVPVHYRLALLLHEAKDMKQALLHYKTVAAATNKEARKVYPRAISQSRNLARKIESYLASSDGGKTKDIAVPRISGD